jgi:UDP-N-acetylglucosamine 1-carboxyvinyltransferase
MAGGKFKFEPSSVGATVNLMLAAALASGPTLLENAAIEPDVIELGRALQKMGARISGLGTRTLEIEGVESLSPANIVNCSDRIEAGTFLIAAAIAGEPGVGFEVARAQPEYLGESFLSAMSETGCELAASDESIVLSPPETLRPVSVVAEVYPGFPTDLQAQWSVLLTQTTGLASVRDPIYPDRFAHIPELVRLGADASVEGNRVEIRGGRKLVGAQVMSTDLRASVSLVLAGMVAQGETHVLRVYHLDRGYERIEDKLSSAGIDIRRERYEEFDQPVPHII